MEWPLACPKVHPFRTAQPRPSAAVTGLGAASASSPRRRSLGLSSALFMISTSDADFRLVRVNSCRPLHALAVRQQGEAAQYPLLSRLSGTDERLTARSLIRYDPPSIQEDDPVRRSNGFRPMGDDD